MTSGNAKEPGHDAEAVSETGIVTGIEKAGGQETGANTENRKKPDHRDVMLAVLAVITAAAVIVAVWAVLTRNRHAAESQNEETRGTTIVTAPTAAPTLTDQIALPQFAYIYLTANETVQTQTFGNPPQNFAQFKVSLTLDGETLWESELLKPGETSEPVVLSLPLEAGEYEARLVYACYTNDGAMSPLNGADSPVTLKVY